MKKKYKYVYDIRLEENEYESLYDIISHINDLEDFEPLYRIDRDVWKEIQTKFKYPEKSRLEAYLNKNE